jgi:hypothetical protein
MEFLKRLSFLSVLIFSFLVQAERPNIENETCLLDENELIFVGEQTIDFLNAWCGDAWCAGDFKHVFLNFVYNGDEKNWYLGFLSFPHELTDTLESRSPTTISSGQIVVHHSICPFPAMNPSSLLLLTGRSTPQVFGLTDLMRNSVNECVIEAETRIRS